jgi:alginate O-acetyltransferase complex protein AlgI
LPLGISFFTFEFVHYLIDAYRGKIPDHSPLTFFGFTFFFPTLVSGPIKRFQPYAASIHENVFKAQEFWAGILLIFLGYSQKYMFADPLIPFTSILEHPEALPSTFSAASGLFLYSLRIYFDFAGLSNIAIGSALLFGILVPRNFNNPYFSPDIQQFWRRWHMSLGSWVLDYIYIPLGGNRGGKIRTTVNLVAAMVIIGIWHGAGWNFAVWGLYHGLGLAAHRVWRSFVPASDLLIARILGTIGTFVFVTIGWAFFVTSSLTDSFLLLSKAFPLF